MDTSTTLDLDGWTAQDAAAILPLTEVSMSQLTVPMVGNYLGDDTARTRKSDPRESHLAADGNDVKGTRALVLAAFHSRQFFADHELVEYLAASGFTPQRIRTARAELSTPENRTLVVAGVTKSPTGRQARVWTLAKETA